MAATGALFGGILAEGAGAALAGGAGGAAAGGIAGGAGGGMFGGSLGSWLPMLAGAGIGLLGNKGSTPQQTVQQQDQNPWAPSIPYLTALMQQIQQYGGSPLPYANPGEMVAPLNQQQAGAVDTTNALTGGATQNVQQAQQGIQPFLNGSLMNVNSNPYLQAATAAAIRPITQNYQENVLPGVQSAFTTNTDAYDQSREGIAKGIASRGYLDAVGNVSSSMANRGYETGLQATQNSFSQIPGLTTAASAPGQAQWNIGALLQAQQQRMQDAPAAFDQLQQQRLQQQLAAYTGIGSIGRGGTGTTTTTGAQANPFLSAVGGGILGQQVYNMWPKTAAPAATGGFNSTGMTADNAAFLPW